ncbi:uncharacterized protein LOC117105339 [Anneissia japonica]|uniref:uncharacterized protein LOC117105339 n=1 Tax=Anneissia japonica TaxID=1529436 RepID=UPI0014256C16|nr:uncharacterized protein LOC117105339 [Anneissia japonica]
MKDPTMLLKRSDKTHNSLVNPNQTLIDALRSNSYTRIKSAMSMPCLEVNRKDTENGGKTVLMNICQLDVLPKTRKELAKMWLKKQNVDSNLRDSDGRTALALACQRGDEGMVKIIAEHSDANPNIVDNSMDTPLMHACRMEGGTNAVKMMITCFGRLNLEVDIMNSKGYTPLLEAARLGHSEVCRLLVKAGADVNIRDPTDNSTAQDLAIQSRCGTPDLLLLSPIAVRKTKARREREAQGRRSLKDLIAMSGLEPANRWMESTEVQRLRSVPSVPLNEEHLKLANSLVFSMSRRLDRVQECPIEEEEEAIATNLLSQRRHSSSLPDLRDAKEFSTIDKLNNFSQPTRLYRRRCNTIGSGSPTSHPVRLPAVARRASMNKSIKVPSKTPSPPQSPRSGSPNSIPRPFKAARKITPPMKPSSPVAAKVGHPHVIESGIKSWAGKPFSAIPSYMFR